MTDVFTARDRYEELRGRGMHEAAATRAANEYDGASHCVIDEVAGLRDGQTVVLRAGLGWFSAPAFGPPGASWPSMSTAAMTQEILNVVLPDDAEESGDEHPWSEFATILGAAGLEVTALQLRTAPYHVVFAPRLRRLLGP